MTRDSRFRTLVEVLGHPPMILLTRINEADHLDREEPAVEAAFLRLRQEQEHVAGEAQDVHARMVTALDRLARLYRRKLKTRGVELVRRGLC